MNDRTDWTKKGTRANIDKFTDLETTPVEKDALKYLTSKGYLEDVGVDGPFRLTARGWDYQEQLKCAPWFWFKNNWFPLVVALATTATSLVAIIVTLIWRPD